MKVFMFVVMMIMIWYAFSKKKISDFIGGMIIGTEIVTFTITAILELTNV